MREPAATLTDASMAWMDINVTDGEELGDLELVNGVDGDSFLSLRVWRNLSLYPCTGKTILG